MALNYIWIALFAIGVIIGLVKLIFFGDMDTLPEMMDSTFKMSTTAFEMTLGLTGTLTLWMGILKIGEDSGLVNRLAKFLSPVLTKLFPEIPKNHPALGSIFMNVSANMLGLDNAATPVGLKAMQELQSINTKKDTASNSMIMFLTLNTSGLTIIPVSIMAYRAKYGAADPADIFIPLLLTTLCSTIVGLTVVSIYQRINLFQRSFLVMFSVIAALVGTLFACIMGMSNQEMQGFCRLLTSILILGAIMVFIISGVKKKLNVYNSFIEGAKNGFHVAVSLIPYCVAILAAVGVFRASGALDMLQKWMKAGVEYIGLNSDFVAAVPVALMKPLNGSGARGMMLECFETYGPDSFVGHLASILQGSTDTTFYILAIYFGSVGIRKYRYSVTCGLLADLAGMVAAVMFSYFFFGAR
ncbi:MAG: nucleoside recognition domain-containing protein [Prevotella sp.]|nr:nucleoside recognition domain-containing protein [Prevotella sp.]